MCFLCVHSFMNSQSLVCSALPLMHIYDLSNSSRISHNYLYLCLCVCVCTCNSLCARVCVLATAMGSHVLVNPQVGT